MYVTSAVDTVHREKVLAEHIVATGLMTLNLPAVLWPVVLMLAVSRQEPAGVVELDRSQPVPTKSEVESAWRTRQDKVKTFRFAWTEQQTHPKGWIPNPRFRQHEWLNTPGLLIDRSYTVSKTIVVDGNKMRYSFELNRPAEPDGIRIVSPQGANSGLGEGKHYVYSSTFDGQIGTSRVLPLAGSLPSIISQAPLNADAQNLDTRPLMMALRPLDPVMGHLLISRAVTNRVRTFYKGRSTFLLEEARDPSGWKTMLRIDPERDFSVSRFGVYFEQRLMVDIDIDYAEDPQWGWLPTGWRISQTVDDGSTGVVADAKVTSYSINQPVGDQEFR